MLRTQTQLQIESRKINAEREKTGQNIKTDQENVLDTQIESVILMFFFTPGQVAENGVRKHEPSA